MDKKANSPPSERALSPKEQERALLGTVVPRLYLQHPDRAAEHVYDGVVLFADISGFTTLTEALSSRGPEGCEALNRLLNAYFTPLISAVEAHGGYLLNLAGDALNALFHNEALGGDDARIRALYCGLAMQRITENFQSVDTLIGDVSLSIKVAVGSGAVHTALVGSPIVGKSFLSYGTALDNAAALESGAKPGQVVADAPTLDAAPEVLNTPLDGGGRLVLGAPERDIGLPSPPPHRATEAQIQAQIHPAVWPYLSRGAGAFLSSIRQVTAMFIGFDEDLESAHRHANLAAYFTAAQAVIDRYRGFLVGFDGGDKGSKLIAVFGAPVAVEHAASRAIECALDLLEESEPHRGISRQRIGIATGALYVGLAGGAGQYRYTAVGDSMNLAARLMKHPSNTGLLVDRVTRSRAGEGHGWGSGQLVKIKGKQEPVEVSAASRQDNAEGPSFRRRGRGIVGRDAELRRIRELTESTLTGRGQVLTIIGEAGIGKSRLLEPLVAQASEMLGVPVLLGTCADYTRGFAYKPWWPVLSHVLGIKAKAPDSEARIREVVARRCPEHIERVGLLGPLINMNMEIPELFRALPPSEQQQLAEDLVVDILCATHGKEGLILIFDDAHWMDSSSASLLMRLARRIRTQPILIVVALRPAKEPHSEQLLQSLQALSQTTTCNLEALSPSAIEVHACQRLGARSLGPDVKAILVERSQCNPLIMEELCDLLSQSQQLVVKRGCARLNLTPEQLVMPESVSGLVLARLDHMSPDARICMQVASVLGRHFTLDQLVTIHPNLSSKDTIKAALGEAHRLDILRVERDSDGQAYFFKHVLSQEAIYSSLTFEVRRGLHTTTAAYFESLCNPDNRAELVPLIAEHYRRTEHVDKLKRYTREAGQLALERHLNRVAASWFVLEAEIREAEGEAEQECAALACAQEALSNLGDLDEQTRIIDRWETVASEVHNRHLLAQVLSAKVSYLHRRGQSAQALTTGARAESILQELGDTVSLIDLKLGMSSIYLESKELAKAQACLANTLTLIEAEADQRLKGRYLGQKGILLMMQGEPEAALQNLSEARCLALQVNDPTAEVHIVGTVGILNYRLKQYDDALTYLSEAADLSNRLGNLRQEGRHRFNLACCAAQLGRLELAREQYLKASMLFERTDYTLGELCTQVNLLHLYWLDNNHVEAQALKARLHPHSDELSPAHRCEYLWILAELALQAGHPAEAINLAQQAIDASTVNGLHTVRVEAMSTMAMAHLAQGDVPAAHKRIDASQTLHQETGAGIEWPSRLHWRRYLVYTAAGDSAAASRALKRASSLLQETLDTLPTDEARSRIINHLAWHKGINNIAGLYRETLKQVA